MADHCAVIINPTSGGYSEEKRHYLETVLVKAGFAPEFLLTGGPDDAERFARQLCVEREHPLVIPCGGDGTVNGVLNGLESGRATLAVVPFGTANVLAHELGINSIEDALARIVRGTTRPMSVGLVQAGDRVRRFFLMAGIGFDGQVVEDLRVGEKMRLGKGAYILSALRRLLDWDRSMFAITADGVTVECHSAVVCNASRYGGRFVLAPAADLFTPGFELVCVRKSSRTAYVALVLATIRGRSGRQEDICRFTCRKLSISGSKAIQIDGDFWGHAPVTVTATADFVRLIV